MKYSITKLLGLCLMLSLFSFTSDTHKYLSQKTHISFYSHAVAEDISANNYKAVSTLDESTGDVVFSVPMQSFEFEKALMQKHFNSGKFLDTKNHPKAKLTGKITNNHIVDYAKDGNYNVHIQGELTIKGTTKAIHEKGTISVKGKTIHVNSKFNIVLADYGVAFEKGKPASNIAKSVEVQVEAEYTHE